jgi:hypothetical protein
MSSRAQRRADTPSLLGKYSENLPGNSPKLTPSKSMKKFMELFDAYPRVVKIVSARVDSSNGHPRKLRIAVLLAAMATEGLTGELHIKKITRTLRALGNGEQIKYGLRWTDKEKNFHSIKDWQIEYLITKIMRAFDPDTAIHNHPIYEKKDGLVIDRATGEILGNVEDFVGENSPQLQCGDSCPGSFTMEQLGNMLLADMHKFLQVPSSTAIAIDSYPLPTHFGTKSFGKVADVDAEIFEQEDSENILDNAVNSDMVKKVRKAEKTKSAAKVKKRKWVTVAQKKMLVEISATFEAAPKMERDPKSRKYIEPGPTVPGDFTRFNPSFPKVGCDGRLQHSYDTGAGNTFRGAGHSRGKEILNGRDKHVAVTTGALPNGSKFPPLPIAFVASKGGSDKAAAGLQTIMHALDGGFVIKELSVDRGYTNVPIERWLTPVRNLGIDIHQDLTKNQRKIKDLFLHVKLIDGWWFPEAIPPGLKALPMHEMRATRAEIELCQIPFDLRSAFAFRPMGHTKDGGVRLRGPSAISGEKKNAQGRVIGVYGATARCKNSKYYHLMNVALPETLCLMGAKCRCSSTIQIRQVDLPSSFEPLLHGTSAWYKAKGARSNVENFNSVE